MKNLRNKIFLTTMMSLFTGSLFAAPANNAFSTPLAPQAPAFPKAPFQQPAFINSFTTPNATKTPQYTVPVPRYFPNTQPMAQQQYHMPTSTLPQYQVPVTAMPLQRMPVAPQSFYPNNFPMQGFPNTSIGNMFPSHFSMGNNNMPFSMPNSFPAMPFGKNGSSNPMKGWNKGWSNMGNKIPFMPQSTNKKKKKAWGDKRYIWPDFYTDFTDKAWDEAMSGPRKLGRMPGGWRFPYISTPDPVTVSDAITNQFPPIAEEAGNMMDISKWGIFDGK